MSRVPRGGRAFVARAGYAPDFWKIEANQGVRGESPRPLLRMPIWCGHIQALRRWICRHLHRTQVQVSSGSGIKNLGMMRLPCPGLFI